MVGNPKARLGTLTTQGKKKKKPFDKNGVELNLP